MMEVRFGIMFKRANRWEFQAHANRRRNQKKKHIYHVVPLTDFRIQQPLNRHHPRTHTQAQGATSALFVTPETVVPGLSSLPVALALLALASGGLRAALEGRRPTVEHEDWAAAVGPERNHKKSFGGEGRNQKLKPQMKQLKGYIPRELLQGRKT